MSEAKELEEIEQKLNEMGDSVDSSNIKEYQKLKERQAKLKQRQIEAEEWFRLNSMSKKELEEEIYNYNTLLQGLKNEGITALEDVLINLFEAKDSMVYQYLFSEYGCYSRKSNQIFWRSPVIQKYKFWYRPRPTCCAHRPKWHRQNYSTQPTHWSRISR